MVDLYATGDPITPEELREEVGLDRVALAEEFQEDARDTYAEREQGLGLNPETEQPLLRDVERFVILQVVDHRWREHLENMDYLREGVHLRSMAQKDPLVEYTSEGHRMFEELNLEIREEVVRTLFHAEIEVEEADQLQQAQAAQALNDGAFAYAHESLTGAQAIAAAGGGGGLAVGGDGATVTAGALDAGGGSVMTQQRVTSDREKNLGRNDPCWCGSGKKFKRCHGA
jgi:preprotein translocase subunit SecA